MLKSTEKSRDLRSPSILEFLVRTPHTTSKISALLARILALATGERFTFTFTEHCFYLLYIKAQLNTRPDKDILLDVKCPYFYGGGKD